jgi:hypothetical protein
MIKKRMINMYFPIRGVRPDSQQQSIKNQNLHYKDICEIELCCNCTEKIATGNLAKN